VLPGVPFITLWENTEREEALPDEGNAGFPYESPNFLQHHAFAGYGQNPVTQSIHIPEILSELLNNMLF